MDLNSEIMMDDPELLDYIRKLSELSYSFMMKFYIKNRKNNMKICPTNYLITDDELDGIYKQYREHIINDIFAYSKRINSSELVEILKGRGSKYLTSHMLRREIFSLVRPKIRRT